MGITNPNTRSMYKGYCLYDFPFSPAFSWNFQYNQNTNLLQHIMIKMILCHHNLSAVKYEWLK